jgi:SOS-response transcriptional repressor LexA
MLTQQQKRLFDYIKWYSAEKGVCPTFAEMMVAQNISSKSRIYGLLEGLEERGHIRRIAHRARAIEIVADPHLPLREIHDEEIVRECERRGYVVLYRRNAEPRLVSRGGTNERFS